MKPSAQKFTTVVNLLSVSLWLDKPQWLGGQKLGTNGTRQVLLLFLNAQDESKVPSLSQEPPFTPKVSSL